MSEVRKVEVYSDAVNAWIVRTGGRRFPGMVLQGDSLRILYDLARQICVLLESSEHEDAYDSALQLEDDLGERLLFYETVLEKNGLSLPYPETVRSVKLPEVED